MSKTTALWQKVSILVVSRLKRFACCQKWLSLSFVLKNKYFAQCRKMTSLHTVLTYSVHAEK